MTTKTEAIRTLNDELRHHLSRHAELAFITASGEMPSTGATRRLGALTRGDKLLCDDSCPSATAYLAFDAR
jgi:hypothetical protein